MTLTIIDSQVHLWDPPSKEHPWTEGGAQHAHRASFSASELLSHMNRLGVSRAILVTPSWVGNNNTACLAAARKEPTRFAVMARISIPELQGRRAFDELWQEESVIGFRLTFNRPDSMNLLTDPSIDWLWRHAEANSAPVALYAPNNIQTMARIAKRYPGLRIVVDHAAIPIGVRGQAIRSHIDELLRLASLPNIAVKATSFPAFASSPYPFPELHQAIRDLVSAFGPYRVFWGSDLTRMPCPYEEALNLFTKCNLISPDELPLIMGHGIAEWLSWPF
jgi:L-fuconolactonase